MDHHKDANKNQENIIKKNLSYPLGSCSTLILLENLFLMEKDLCENLDKSLLLKLFKENILFLISAILIDTSNFSEEGFNTRWTSLDKIAYEKIKYLNKKYFPNKFSKKEAKNFYKELNDIKFDEMANLNLGIPKIFNKDKKEFIYLNKKKVLWSSLQVNLDLINETFSENLVEKFIEENIIDNSMWVLKYNKKENEIKYSYIAIFFNKEGENNSNFIENFQKDFKEFLFSQNEISDLIKSFDIFNKKILILLDNSITRKNFEPYFKKYFESTIIN